MGIHFIVPGTKRKELAHGIGSWLGEEVHYLRAPTYAYRIGYVTVDRDGNFSADDTADEETVERLLEHLYDAGFESEPDGCADSTESAAEPVPDVTDASSADSTTDSAMAPAADPTPAPDEEEADERIGISLPEDSLPPEAGANLDALIAAKGILFRKAVGVDTLPLECGNGKVTFPWLHEDAGPEDIEALSRFLTALCRMAKNAKRVTAKEKEVPNDKYAFR